MHYRGLVLASLLLALIIVGAGYIQFEVSGQQAGPIVSDVQYDPDTEILHFSLASDSRTAKGYVTDSTGLATNYHSFILDGVQSIDVSDLAEGTCTLTVFFSSTDSTSVQFMLKRPVIATGAELNENSITLAGGRTFTLTPSLLPTGTTDTISNVEWTSSNNGGYVVVVKDGVNGVLSLNAVASSKQTVTATVTTQSGSVFSCSCEVETQYGALEGLDSHTSLFVGDSLTLQVNLPEGVNSAVWSKDSNCITLDGSGSTATITANSEGTSTVTVVAKRIYKASTTVEVSSRPVVISSYDFYLKITRDADKADYGQSGLDAPSLANGIHLGPVTGPDAGTALENALRAEKIPCEFWTSDNNLYRHWVENIFGLGDVHLSNGDWAYWIQTQGGWYDEGGSYNDKTLGYYDRGGSFYLTYGVTSDPRSEVMVDIPDGKELIYNGSNQKGVSSNQYYTATNNEGKNVGTYKAVLKLKDSENAKYIWKDGTDSDKEIEWSIVEAHLKATYTGDVIEYGGTPALTVQVTGFVSGDSPRTIQGYQPPTVSDEGCVAVGTYTLTPSGGNPGTNYVFDYVSGSLVINRVVISEETNTNDDGSTTTTVTEKDPDSNGIIVTETTTTSTKDKDGNIIDSTEITTTNKDSDGNVTGSTEKSETVKTDKEGNIIESSTTEFVKDKDGNITSSTEGVTNYSKEKDKNGNDVDKEITVTTNKDGNGNVIGSNERSETKDKDGNLTEKSEVVKDKDGNETYSKLEEYVPESTRVEEGNTITESSNRVTEKESGKITVVSESVVEIVKSDGQTEKQTVKEESVTGTDGKNETTKVTENVKEDLDGDVIKSTQTDTKDADGKESTEKKVEAESKDGSVTSSVEIPNDSEKADIVTVVKTDSEDGSHTVSAEQIQQAVSIQEKVSEAISEDVKEQTKVITVESETVDASLTVSQDAVKAVSDSGSELKMVSQEGSMQISKEILDNLSDVEDVTISFSKSEDAVKEKMTDAQKEAVDENATVMELKITSGDTSLGDRLGGTLTVTVKHKQAEGMVAVAYYIADDGTKEKLNGTYDPAKGEMSFETTHCSIYAIVDESSEPEPVPGPIVDPDEPSSGDKDDGMMLYIGIAVAVIAAIAVAGVLYMRKN